MFRTIRSGRARRLRELKRPLRVECLESRELLSTTALPARFGSSPNEWDSVTYHQSFEQHAPTDMYTFRLRAGDVLNVTAERTSGEAPTALLLTNRSGKLLLHTADPIPALPDRSPISAGTDVGLAYLVTVGGDYQVDVHSRFGTSGDYDIRFHLFRPALEDEQAGTKQILFLDFDGARINPFALFDDGNDETVALSPLGDYLDDFGLVHRNASAEERSQIESQFVTKIVATVRENLLTNIARSGVNRMRPGRDPRGAFDLLIVDSRSGYDPWGQSNVSRVIVGGGNSETGIVGDIAESVDVGNMITNESALVQIESKTHLINGPLALPINPDLPNQQAAQLDLIATYIGNVISHEAGHLFGLYHAEDTNDKRVLMDQSLTRFLGDDGIYGTSDDVNLDFGVDDFKVSRNDFFATFTKGGYASNVDVLSFSLSTGIVVRGDTNGDGAVNARDVNVIGQHWNQRVTPQTAGDLNGDGVVDAIDLNQLGLGWLRLP